MGANRGVENHERSGGGGKLLSVLCVRVRAACQKMLDYNCFAGAGGL